MSAIHVEDLTVAYDLKPVLWNVNVEIPERTLTAIVGPNGAGKSTFIKAIINLIKPVSGKALFLGESYIKMRKKIAYVPQRGSVDWDFPTTVSDVVLMGRYGHTGWIKRPGKEDKKIAANALSKLGMSTFSNRQISELSGGQQQRVFLARALAQDAEIYLMDEPFQGVDAKTEKAIVTLLKELKSRGRTVVAVHHDLSTVKEYFDRVLLINKQVVAGGAVNEVFTEENVKKTYSAQKYGCCDD